MKQPDNMLQRITDISDLPGEVMPGMPLVEIAGDRRVLIENHKGVTEFGNSRICVRVSYGHLSICGDEMTIAQMTRYQLVISGRIDSLTLLRRDHK